MNYVSDALVGLVAILQFWFLVLEMFLWRTPRTIQALGLTNDFAEQSHSMAKNQGLYNGFLSAGLLWGLMANDPDFAFEIKFFFLTCVLIAGVFGAATANMRILFVQAVPALLAMISLVFV